MDPLLGPLLSPPGEHPRLNDGLQGRTPKTGVPKRGSKQALLGVSQGCSGPGSSSRNNENRPKTGVFGPVSSFLDEDPRGAPGWTPGSQAVDPGILVQERGNRAKTGPKQGYLAHMGPYGLKQASNRGFRGAHRGSQGCSRVSPECSRVNTPETLYLAL